MPAAPLRTLQRGRLFALAPSLGLPGRSSRRSSRSMERERRLERETGIEPATNSLEGCDSTTELLPPTRLAASLPRRYGGQARLSHAKALSSTRPENTEGSPSPPTFSIVQRANLSPRALDAREKVGGEGRVRTSVARRRQVYSLLRLTALPPPRIFVVVPPAFTRSCVDDGRMSWNRVCCVDVSLQGAPSVELAEGFEPPTG